jgi:Domain of unknown function (DUF4123)
MNAATSDVDNTTNLQVSHYSDVLHRQFDARGDCPYYLWIDPSLLHLRNESALWQLLEDRKAIGVPSYHAQLDARLCPQLYALDTALAQDSAIVQTSLVEAFNEMQAEPLSHGYGRAICGWLQTDEAPEALARRIGHAMIQTNARGQKVLIRYYDPAVIWALLPHLEEAQRSTLIGEGSDWYALDPTRNLMHLQAPKSAAQATATASNWLTSKQWPIVEQTSPLHTALNAWGLDPLTPEALYAARTTAQDALARAAALRITEPQDLAAFALHALQLHPHFDQHPTMQTLLKQCTEGRHYSALADELTADQVQRIKADMNERAA